MTAMTGRLRQASGPFSIFFVSPGRKWRIEECNQLVLPRRSNIPDRDRKEQRYATRSNQRAPSAWRPTHAV
jgi:hypothetical protein